LNYKKNDTIFFHYNKLSNYPSIAISFSYIDIMSERVSAGKVDSESNVERKKKIFTQCRFGKNCTKGVECPFSHDGSTSKESAGGVKPKAECRYGKHCTNPSCTFGSHPPMCLAGLNCQCIETCDCLHFPMCPYGPKCKKMDVCTFIHASKPK